MFQFYQCLGDSSSGRWKKVMSTSPSVQGANGGVNSDTGIFNPYVFTFLNSEEIMQ